MQSIILLTLTFVIFSMNSWAQPCPPDSLHNPVPPSTSSVQTDSLTDPFLPCYDYPCKVDVCHQWEFPPNFSGLIEIWTNTTQPTMVNVQIWENCHWIRFDSCVSIALPTVLKWDTLLNLPQRSQLVVCNSALPITVALKEFPETDTLPPFFCDIDTLCGAFVGVPKPKTTKKPLYYELPNLILTDKLEPNKTYKVARKEENQ